MHREIGQGENQTLVCKVLHGGLITSHKGINLPDTELSVPALTARDYQCVDFAVEKGFDFLALSFVRSGTDVRQLKNRLHELGARDERLNALKPRSSRRGRFERVRHVYFGHFEDRKAASDEGY